MFVKHNYKKINNLSTNSLGRWLFLSYRKGKYRFTKAKLLGFDKLLNKKLL